MSDELKIDDISFIIPSRNNLKYLKWCYDAIREVYPDVWVCYWDDFSDDGTWDWMQDRVKNDPKVKAERHDGPKREGHTILYDRIAFELCETKLGIIFHADMHVLPNMLENMLKHMKRKVIVSATRIEPPLHPDGPEKHLFDFGVEPETFKKKETIEFAEKLQVENKDKITRGVFAPWMFYIDDFEKIGGHWEIYAPQSAEDSDAWNRLLLDGHEFIQARDSFVAHLTCRGSRRNPNLTNVTQDSPEWLEQNVVSRRNFIRAWGTNTQNDAYIHPIVSHKYDIGFQIEMDVDDQTTFQLLGSLEPWCSTLATDVSERNAAIIDHYQTQEQENTKFDLNKRVVMGNAYNDVVIHFKASEMLQNQQANFQFIQQLPDILTDSGEVGEMEYGCFKIKIKDLTTYEKDLIVCKNTGWRRKNHK